MRRPTNSSGHTPRILSRVLSRLLLAATLAPTLGPSPVVGQETESPLSPAGRLRLEIAPSFLSWDSRFGVRSEDGRLVESSEPLGFELDARDASDLFPGVTSLEGALRSLTGDEGYTGTLGAIGAVVSADRVTVPFRLDVGVLDRLTVGVTVPLVKSRTELDFAFDSSGANLGASPAVSDPTGVASWAAELTAGAEAARTRASDLCAADPSSSECATASALADDLQAFRSGIFGAYGASLLFPTPDSPAGAALRERAAELSGRLTDAGLDGVDAELPLGAPLADRAGFDAFVEQAFGTPALADRIGLWELGDVELHAAFRVLDGVVRDSAGAPARARWVAGAGALVRLGTGSPDDPDVVLDLGSGDGQTDVEGRVFANATWGRLGLWTDARYGVQLSTTLPRRIAPPEVVFVSRRSLAQVEWTPGNYVRLEVAPRYHLTDELAFSGGYRLWHKAQDRYRRLREPTAGDPDPLVPTGPIFTDAGLLELETEETRHELGLGLVYNTVDAWLEERAPVPLEGRFTVRWAVAGGGGRTAQTFRTEIALRLYRRLWGG